MVVKKNILVLGAPIYANWLDFDVVGDIRNADLVMFTGGEDVTPEMYAEERHDTTNCSWLRDAEDKEWYNFAKDMKIPIIGICRGSQLLTVMQPMGKLIQDVDNHEIFGTHHIEDIDGNVLEITSTHHQMHYLNDMDENDYELIAWSRNRTSSHYSFGDRELKPDEMPKGFKESEIVYFKKSNALGIQGHPEMLEYNHDTNKYLRELVNNKLFNND